jgi:hypothetical protein
MPDPASTVLDLAVPKFHKQRLTTAVVDEELTKYPYHSLPHPDLQQTPKNPTFASISHHLASQYATNSFAFHLNHQPSRGIDSSRTSMPLSEPQATSITLDLSHITHNLQKDREHAEIRLSTGTFN